MIDKFEEAFGKGALNLLPDHPRFVFCGTDMALGANSIFERWAPTSPATRCQRASR